MIWIILGLIVAALVIIYVYVSNAHKETDARLKETGFSITRSAGNLRVDDKNKKWCINSTQCEPTIYDFSEIIDSKIEENSVLNKVKKLGVYIYTKNGGAVYIPLINSETNRDGFLYSSSMEIANQINSMVKSMISRSDEKSLDLPERTQNSSQLNGDIEEQLTKLKRMADTGLITNEEFESKKKQLLGL